MNKVIDFLNSSEFVAFFTFFCLFVIFAPGMVVELDEATDIIPGHSKIVKIGVKNIPQAIIDVMTLRKAPGNSTTKKATITNAMTVVMHGILGGLVASAVFSIDRKAWTFKYVKK
uniref:Uncharacterized protein n=1 Tax=viral metagenome TaxID=1070528 RepID=A0A6C0K8P0_9ZZZZ